MHASHHLRMRSSKNSKLTQSLSLLRATQTIFFRLHDCRAEIRKFQRKGRHGVFESTAPINTRCSHAIDNNRIWLLHCVLRLLLPTEQHGLSVCQSVCHLVSPARTAKVIELLFASTTLVGPGKPVAYSAPLRVNTVLCSFNTIQPSS